MLWDISSNMESPHEFIRKLSSNTPSDEETSDSSNPPKCPEEKRKLESSDNTSSDKDSASIKRRKFDDEEEALFTKLCEMALSQIRLIKNISDEDIKKGVTNVKQAFHYSEGRKFSDIDFSKPENLWGYFLRHGPTSAGLIRNRVQTYLNANIELKNYLFAKETIKISSLGSGPGCDIVGLCSSIQQYVNNKTIHLTLVDSVKGWVSFFNIIEFLLREGSFGNASECFKNNDISTNYLCFDLTRDSSENEAYERSLKEANIIMLNRVISIIDNYYDKTRIASGIVDNMKTGAVLFLIEPPHYLTDTPAFQELEFLGSEEQEEYSFQGPSPASFIYVARESKAKIFVYRKK